MRIEKDAIGIVEIPSEKYYGIHTARSLSNFPDSGEKVNPYFIKAFLQVKLAAADTNFKIGIMDKTKHTAISEAVNKLLKETENAINKVGFGIYEKIVVDSLQGGAGTSLNMNINEVIANTALEILGKEKGEYDFIHPIDDVNQSQSTNDTYPTALKIASIYLMRILQDTYAKLQGELQKKEVEFMKVMKLGRTQFQDAVPITLGQEFGAYAQAVARDRWRIYNAEERLRAINMGGTAVGTSIAAHKNFVLKIAGNLKTITGLPISKAEDLIDATQNLDVFAEAHGIIKAGAVSLIKICNDLRFMSSGPDGGIGEIKLTPRQTGSSIMPGKVNPVILEHTIQAAEIVKGHDVIINNVVGAGNMELNAFAPLLGHAFLRSMGLLSAAANNLAEKAIPGISANEKRCTENLMRSSAIAAALINRFGYDKIQEIVKSAHSKDISFIEELKQSNIIEENEIIKIVADEIGVRLE